MVAIFKGGNQPQRGGGRVLPPQNEALATFQSLGQLVTRPFFVCILGGWVTRLYLRVAAKQHLLKLIVLVELLTPILLLDQYQIVYLP